jgi:hypothetical protein
MSASTIDATKSTLATSDDPEVVAFYTALSAKDRIIHDLATKMLNTRYTPQRSNAWAAWKRQTQKK